MHPDQSSSIGVASNNLRVPNTDLFNGSMSRSSTLPKSSFSEATASSVCSLFSCSCVLTASPAVLYTFPSAPTRMSANSASPVVLPVGNLIRLSIRFLSTWRSCSNFSDFSVTLLTSCSYNVSVIPVEPASPSAGFGDTFNCNGSVTAIVFPFVPLRTKTQLPSLTSGGRYTLFSESR